MIFFRLSNISTDLAGCSNKILAEKLDLFIILYLDNILIYSNNEYQGHVKAVCLVLN